MIGGTGANLISPPFGFTSTGALTVDNIELIQTGNTVPTPMQEQLIWQADFDSTFPNTAVYGFHYRDGTDDASGIVTTNVGGGIGGSNSLEYTVDLSSWSSTPPVSYSGFGVGATENPLPFVLTSSNKASYRVYVSAKAGGILAGASTNIPAVLDLLFTVPAGAESPSNASPAVVLDLNPSLTLTTNWQSYVFDNMAIGVNNGGSQALFNQYVSKVNQMQVQVVAQGSPNVATIFGYDTNNTVDIDNIKVVQLVPGLPPVSVAGTAGQVKIYWTDPATGGFAQLQSSTNVAGPYLNVPGETSGADFSLHRSGRVSPKIFQDRLGSLDRAIEAALAAGAAPELINCEPNRFFCQGMWHLCSNHFFLVCRRCPGAKRHEVEPGLG